MRVEMYPVGEKDEDRFWTLELGDNRVQLLNHRDRVVADWSSTKAVGRFQMPSFWASRKKFGVTLDGETIDFDVGAKELKKIQGYVDRVYVHQHPDAPARALMIGGLMAAGGLAMVVTAGVVWYLTYQRAAGDPEGGRYLVWTGGILVGISIACRGIYKMTEYPKLRRLVAEAGD